MKVKTSCICWLPRWNEKLQLYDLATKRFFPSRDAIFSERDFHDFRKDTSSKFEYIFFDFDEKVDPDIDRNEVNEEKNHEIEENFLPVGAAYEENFMRQVAHLQGV